MGKLQWMIVRIAERIGLVAGLAWLLVIIIALYWFYVFLPTQQRLSLLEQQLLEVSPVQQVVYDYVSPSDQFFNNMPNVESVTSSIQTLFNIAAKQHIVINEVVYKNEEKTGENIVRYTMSFSVVASYPKIKTFVINTLAAIPYLALDQLTFERDEINAKIVSAQLRFSLYLVR